MANFEFKPFDKVLVRNRWSMWIPAFYGMKSESKHLTSAGWQDECIPYEGNEEYLGTSNNYVDKVPKFKVGDWVVVDDGRIGRIIELTKNFADVDLEFSYLSTRVNNIRSWNIQDAKDGDVLCTKNKCCPFIYDKRRYNNGLAYYYAGIDVSGNLNIKSPHNMLAHFGRLDNIRPATQKQRDLLFKKMKEAGCEWDAEKKELKKIEQKPVESQQDMLSQEQYVKAVDECIYGEKSVEWSEEDEEKINSICNIIADKRNIQRQGYKSYYNGLINWLKSLRPQSTWKPSDEQIKVCKEIYADLLSAKGFDLGTVNSELNRLEEELKKLRKE